MNRNHLALFGIVAQAGGISLGAAKARISQPAVSKQIKELEQALGLPLLERLPRGIRLTDAGQLLYHYTQRLATLEREAELSLEEFRGLKLGRLAVGASTTIGSYLLPRVMGLFQAKFPGIGLRLEVANTRDIEQLLKKGDIELGLTEGMSEDSQLESTVFHQDELVAIAPRGHPLARAGSISARELCSHPFIHREEGSGTRAVVERALATLGLSVNPVLALASTEAIKGAVIAGLGIAIISRLTIALELRFGSLAIIPVKDLTLRRPLHLQRLRDRSHTPAGTRFLELLSSSVAALPAERSRVKTLKQRK